MPQIYDMRPTALLPLRRKACWGFFRPKNPTASAGFEPANLGTKGQHATPRPPKPLVYYYTLINIGIIWRAGRANTTPPLFYFNWSFYKIQNLPSRILSTQQQFFFWLLDWTRASKSTGWSKSLCNVIMRCTETFWSPCINILSAIIWMVQRQK